MARGLGAWRWVVAIGLVGACGGDPFVLGDASAPGQSLDGSAKDGGVPQEAGSDAPPSASSVYCGPTATCAAKPICCTGVTTGTSCAAMMSGCGCVTRLACSSNSNCPAAQAYCCIRSVSDPSCGTNLFVAACSPLPCGGGATRLCDPNAAVPGCAGSKACATDTSALQNVGLPTGQGFGVCGN
jgi:hypothetical protein